MQHLADMMNKSYLSDNGQETCNEFEVVNAVQFFPMGQAGLQKFRLETERDKNLQVLKPTILKGWPEDKSKVPSQVTPYNSIYDELVFKGEQLISPQALSVEIKRDLHASHAGVEGCLWRARESVY